ncbi:MAG: hypothetical protein K2J39_04160, partial [Ruminococcus sp.]|nr:hypothetical protein [Ruminococcus sp.]
EITDDSKESDIDRPLFTDADVIEEIEKSENSTDNRPFWETPDVSGEQLSMFDDPVPISKNKQPEPKEETFAEGLFVGNVNRYTALHDEIIRGTGFQGGKSRVQKFYDEKKPTNKEFAGFLKHEYGIGGHSGDGEISFVDHDAKGMFFTHENGEKFKFTWDNIAAVTAELIDKGEYIVQTDTDRTIQNEKDIVEYSVPDSPIETGITDDTSKKTDISEKTELSAKIESDRNSVTEKSEQLENNITEEKPETVEIGDKFRNKMTGKIFEVTSLSEFITDECTVKHESNGVEITENIPDEKLLDENLYEYIGNGEIIAENAEIPEKTDIKIVFEVVGGG